MISDSVPWKESLLATAARIERKVVQKRWTERSMFLFERDVMTAAYSVRKLIESHKVSDTLARKSWPLIKFARIGPVPDVYNFYAPEELFDLSSSTRFSLSTLEITNQIVHSFLFFPVWQWHEETGRRGNLISLSFVSDRRRRDHLLSIDIGKIIELLNEVGDEDVISVTMRPDENGERYFSEVVGVGRGDPRHWASGCANESET
ncbi:hypothetical protein M1843_15810 [Isoptericola sp. 4D.3]|uniref:Uncharacterized protein n=1 Tax=Isoptericola peretonis TaxID=2918523 RepID=A0ABT0J6V6_9MICO|nr:hypothetical protein [Isoptericola sp. 4D.3]